MVFGYSMAFGEGNAFFGNPFKHFFLQGIGAAPERDYAATVPEQTFMLFQMMFAIITPALISGAVAERIKFKAYLLFIVLWTTVVYFPLCHMMWGKGGLFNWALGGKIPVLDFAGGTVVHISSGVSALVCALVLGKRLGYPREPMPPHNVVLSLVGAGLLWVGWYRLQRRQRGQRRQAGQQRVCGDTFFCFGCGAELGVVRVAAEGQAKRTGGCFRHGGWAGDDHPGLRFRFSPLGAVNWTGCGGSVLFRRVEAQSPVWLR